MITIDGRLVNKFHKFLQFYTKISLKPHLFIRKRNIVVVCHLIISSIQQIAIVHFYFSFHFSQQNSSFNLDFNENDKERIQKVNVNPPYTLLHNNNRTMKSGALNASSVKEKQKKNVVLFVNCPRGECDFFFLHKM